MTIEFGDNGTVEVPGVGPVIGSEFAQVSVTFDVQGNSPRLRLEDLRTGRVRYLDALELESIVWLPQDHLSSLMDPSANRCRGGERGAPRSFPRCGPPSAHSAARCRRCAPRTWPPGSSRRWWPAAASTPRRSKTSCSPSPTPTPSHRASAGGQRCTPAYQPQCRGCR